MNEYTVRTFIGNDCDFCKGITEFAVKSDSWGQAWWLEGLNGSGSDHLATWCGKCGPKHRSETDRIYREKVGA